MLRLSKKGWNNVLIFAMLIMIMVFNGLHKRIEFAQTEPEDVLILPENSLVLTLQVGNVAIERIGQSWRSNPVVDLSAEQLAKLMLDWKGQKAKWHQQDAEAKLMTEGKEPDFFVVASLAGKVDGAVYAFYPQLESVWLHDQHQQRWLELTKEQLELLIPQPLRI